MEDGEVAGLPIERDGNPREIAQQPRSYRGTESASANRGSAVADCILPMMPWPMKTEPLRPPPMRANASSTDAAAGG
jgi:hypothetical protein